MTAKFATSGLTGPLGGEKSVVEVLKVSTKSSPNAVAGALAGILRGGAQVELCVVGAGALNQAIKAIAIARTFVVDDGIDLICVPTFAEVDIDGESRTALRVRVEDRRSATIDLTGEATIDVARLSLSKPPLQRLGSLSR